MSPTSGKKKIAKSASTRSNLRPGVRTSAEDSDMSGILKGSHREKAKRSASRAMLTRPFWIRQIFHDVDVTDSHQTLADHSLQGGQKRLNPLRDVHHLDAHGQVLAQLQQPGRVQPTTRP